MPEQVHDPVLAGFASGMMLLSLATALCLLIARTRGPWLRFEPRALAPWNAAGAVLALFMVGFAMLSAVNSWSGADDATKESGLDHSVQLVAAMIQELFLVGGVVTFIVLYFGALPADLGLPSSARQAAKDILIGLVACVAMLAPVQLIQYFGLKMLGEPDMQSGHELVKMLMEGDAGIGVLILGTVYAVVVAPICEEIGFRLLLQGWLEKWEARAVRCMDRSPCGEVAERDASVADASAIEGVQITVDESGIAENLPHIPSRPVLETPPPCGVVGLPFGWVPIGISSALFGLAHLGYGPEPVPLFVLALALGYIYNRTHRILPSIVAHSLFNLFTMVMLWRMVLHGKH